MTPELLIVGAGPAGVSAALWARALDLTASLIESAPAAGGQLHQVHFHPSDLPGIVDGDGHVIAATYQAQLDELGMDMRWNAVATALEPPQDGNALPGVRLVTGERLEAAAILIATGVRRRRLDVPGEQELEGRGVSYSATRDRVRFAGRSVAVAGGGDAAFENALRLAEVGCRVTLIVRGAPRARPEFRQRVAAEPAITLLEDSHVTAVLGESEVKAVRVAGPAGEREIEVEGLIVKIGVVPNTEWCRASLDCDADGFVRVDTQLATSMPRVFAAGDVTRPAVASVVVAGGHGALAVAAVRAALRGA